MRLPLRAYRPLSRENASTVLEDAAKAGNVGRAVVTPFGSRSDTAPGIVTVSGMRTSEVSGVAGVFLATETTASRRHALPIVPLDELARWSTKQANELLKVCSADLTEQIAPIISSLLGDIGEFKVRDYHGARQSIAEIAQRKDLPDELLIVDPTFSFSGTRKPGAMAYIISTQFHIPLRGLVTRDVWPPLSLSQPDGRARLARTAAGVLIAAVAESWGVDLDLVLDVSGFDPEGGRFNHDPNDPVFASLESWQRGQVGERIFLIRKPVSGVARPAQ